MPPTDPANSPGRDPQQTARSPHRMRHGCGVAGVVCPALADRQTGADGGTAVIYLIYLIRYRNELYYLVSVHAVRLCGALWARFIAVISVYGQGAETPAQAHRAPNKDARRTFAHSSAYSAHHARNTPQEVKSPATDHPQRSKEKAPEPKPRSLCAVLLSDGHAVNLVFLASAVAICP